MTTLMLSINDECFEILASLAKARGVNVQMLIRAVIIPEWTQVNLDEKVSTINNTSGTSNNKTGVDARVLSPNTIAKTPWREVDTYRSLYFRNIRR
jgi:hypothetical protein